MPPFLSLGNSHLDKHRLLPITSNRCNSSAIRPVVNWKADGGATTACGLVRAIRQNDNIKGTSGKSPDHKTALAGCMAMKSG